MPIVKQEEWDECVKNNEDPYGKACVDVARRVMELLDEQDEFDPHKIICQADDELDVGGITGFMAGAVASMVGQCHSRGDEFRRAWNLDTAIGDEGEKANESGGTLNPALLTIDTGE